MAALFRWGLGHSFLPVVGEWLRGVIWDDEYTIDELIFKNGVYYYNQNSEEWEEDDEKAWEWSS